MRLSILQFVDPGLSNPLPEFSQSLGIAAALLKADGFEVSLITMSGYDAELLRQALLRHLQALRVRTCDGSQEPCASPPSQFARDSLGDEAAPVALEPVDALDEVPGKGHGDALAGHWV